MRIGEFIRARQKEGLNDRSILSLVKAEFPNARTTLGSIRWYRWKDKKTDDDVGDDSESEEVLDALETTFGLEKDLQHALRVSIEQLEPGLTIVDGGQEQTVTSGRIDITAKDPSGVTVVIELKAGSADRDTIGQILSYMGDLSETGQAIRGILVAADFSPRAIAATRATPNIKLVKYTFKFLFEGVQPT